MDTKPRVTKTARKAAKSAEQAEIQSYFTATERRSLSGKIGKGLSQKQTDIQSSRPSSTNTSPDGRQSRPGKTGQKECLGALPYAAEQGEVSMTLQQEKQGPPAGQGMEDLMLMISALPTKSDIEALIAKVEEAQIKQFQQIQEDLHQIGCRMEREEGKVEALERRLEEMEGKISEGKDRTRDMQLKIEEMEDRNRRQNLRIWGLPEKEAKEDLKTKVMLLLADIMGADMPEDLVLDRVHRTLGPKAMDATKPRDVVCHFQSYLHKEAVLRKSWEKGTIDWGGSQVKILPDVSKATLYRRALLKPLMEKVKQKGGTYKWRFPFAVTITLNTKKFFLKTPDDLPELFVFMEMAPIEVEDWLQLFQEKKKKSL